MRKVERHAHRRVRAMIRVTRAMAEAEVGRRKATGHLRGQAAVATAGAPYAREFARLDKVRGRLAAAHVRATWADPTDARLRRLGDRTRGTMRRHEARHGWC